MRVVSPSPTPAACFPDPADGAADADATVPAGAAVASGAQAPGGPLSLDGVLPPFDDLVDLGSWAAFEPSLAALLDGQSLSGPGRKGLTLLLTAPRAVVTQAQLEQRLGLRSLLRGRRRRLPSPEVPGLVVVARADGVEVDVPVLDAEGRHLLGPDAREALGRLGWVLREDVMVRLLPDGASAARAVTRVLIEMLSVAHPADLDHLITVTG